MNHPPVSGPDLHDRRAPHHQARTRRTTPPACASRTVRCSPRTRPGLEAARPAVVREEVPIVGCQPHSRSRSARRVHNRRANPTRPGGRASTRKATSRSSARSSTTVSGLSRTHIFARDLGSARLSPREPRFPGRGISQPPAITRHHQPRSIGRGVIHHNDFVWKRRLARNRTRQSRNSGPVFQLTMITVSAGGKAYSPSNAAKSAARWPHVCRRATARRSARRRSSDASSTAHSAACTKASPLAPR